MSTRVRLLSAAVLIAVAFSASPSDAQGSTPSPSVRDYCIKVTPGKAAEFTAYLHDVAVPLAQARADSGEFAWFAVARGYVPAGTSAPCDYRVMYGYKGDPPEEISTEGLEVALKRAKLALTADQLIAKRSSLTTLVALEDWGQIERVGPPAEKGSYLEIYHDKVPPDDWDEWLRLERRWKAYVDAYLKAGGKGAWGLYQLYGPGGDSMPYNGASVNVFPDWNGLLQEWGAPQELWLKVHPDMTFDEFVRRHRKTHSTHDIQVYKIVEFVRAK